ncbi:Ig-like domain-containing protein [Marvinbryantia formatexigens]|nr:Ig-like domain-containing protein [Marvinbryantia formatexigens]UWO23403.1 Ig-like domain-containing protein [Marvinbryantia formatexigens DSM 14469]
MEKMSMKCLKRAIVALLIICTVCLPVSVSAACAVKLNSTARTLYKGQSYTLKVSGTKKKVKWKTSNSGVAKVSASGKVTAKKAGTATITASVSGKNLRAKITVKNPTVKLNKSSATIYTSGTTSVQLKATVKGASQKVTWQSSNKAVAMVNSKGKVTAKKTGTVTITAKANGVIAKCKVTVKKKMQGVAGRQEQHRKYVNYIAKFDQKNKKSMEYCKGIMYTGSFSARTYFAFADIDGNGIDECIVRFTGANGENTATGTGGPLERTEIYTIQDNKIKAVVKQDAAWCGNYQGVSVYKNSNLIGFYTSGHSITENELYAYVNGNLAKSPKYSCCYVRSNAYYINGDYQTGRKVTYTEYKTYLNHAKANLQGYPMYAYTSTNLNKFI